MRSESIHFYVRAVISVFKNTKAAEEWLDKYSDLLTKEVDSIDEAISEINSIIHEIQ